MKKNKWFIMGMLAAAFVLAFAACGGSGGSGAGSSAAAAGGGNTSPVTDFSYDLSEDGQGIVITGYTGAGGKVVIPATIEDMPVVEIGKFAFRGQTTSKNALGEEITEYFPANEITEIVIPDSVVTIRQGSFFHIDKITKANLPASLESIGWASFDLCGELSDLVIPSTLSSVKFLNFDGSIDGTEQPANIAFQGCGKLPLKTRQTITDWGYTSGF